jgi:hypothetical protein
MGRDRQYASDADRQRAYRQRKAAEEARLREMGADARLQEELRRIRVELQRAREEVRRARARPSSARRAVSERLVKVLGMLGSDYPGERANAAQMATQILKDAGLTWYDVLDVEREPRR